MHLYPASCFELQSSRVQTLVVSPGDASVWSYHRWLCHAALQHATPQSSAGPCSPATAERTSSTSPAQAPQCPDAPAGPQHSTNPAAAPTWSDGSHAQDAIGEVRALLDTEEARCDSIVADERARQASAAAAVLGAAALHGSVAWPLQRRAELSQLQRQLQDRQVRH